MKIVIFQVLTVLTMACLVIELGLRLENFLKGRDELGETLWIVKVQGYPTPFELPAGNFLVGNGLFNDIYMNAGKERVRLYFNIQKDKILISVLKGKIRMGNITYKSNKREQITIEDCTRVYVGNLELKFVKKGGI